MEVGSEDKTYNPEPVWISTINQTADWAVKMTSFSFGRTKSKKISAAIDVLIASATSMSYIPKTYWTKFLAGIGESKKTKWTFDNTSGYFKFKSCSSVTQFNAIVIDFTGNLSVYIEPKNFI